MLTRGHMTSVSPAFILKPFIPILFFQPTSIFSPFSVAIPLVLHSEQGSSRETFWIFHVSVVHISSAAGSEDHTDADCFGAAFLSHGDEGVIFGVDGVISIDALLAPIKKCKSLAGKPKLFFFQVRFPLNIKLV